MTSVHPPPGVDREAWSDPRIAADHWARLVPRPGTGLAAQERTPRGLLLQALYPLAGKVPGLRRVPLPIRRVARRSLTRAAVRAHLARCAGTTIVGVTGSSGKTTTKDLLAAMLAPCGPTLRTRHNDNDLYGVPATLMGIRPSDRFAVVELGILERPGEMDWMAGLFRPRVAVLTGVGDDHLPAYGSRAAIAAEKRSLLARLGPEGTAVVRAGDRRAARAAGGLGCRVLYAGEGPEAAVRLLDAELRWPHGMQLTISVRGVEVSTAVALHARHLAPLVAIALAAALECGADVDRALAGLAAFRPPPGRLQPREGPAGSMFLLDDFKSRRETALAAVDALAAVPAGRRIVVLGEVQDRGHDRDTYRPIAASLERVADRVVAVGRCGPPLRALLAGSGLEAEFAAVRDAHAAAAHLEGNLGPGDVLLVHGAARQHLNRIAMLLDGREVGCRVARCTYHWRCDDCPFLATGPPPDRVEAA